MSFVSSFHLPVFIWLTLLGSVVCFLLGYFQKEKVVVLSKTGQKSVRYHYRYDNDFVVCVAAAFGLAVVITFLRYTMVIPRFFILRVLLFVAAIFAIAVVVFVLWGIALKAESMSDSDEVNKK